MRASINMFSAAGSFSMLVILASLSDKPSPEVT